jgi:hypothetical protein
MRGWGCIAAAVVLVGSAAHAEEQGGGQVAQELQNPVANLVSVPLQFNENMGIGPANENQLLLNFQPVIPISLTPDWNVITRTIVPIVSNPPSSPGGERRSGIGDTSLSLFFSPAKAGSVVWGLGPAAQLPTASRSALGTGQFALGPTGVLVFIVGGVTTGVLASQIWSVAGRRGGADVSSMLVQPFFSYTVGSGVSAAFTSEITRNWEVASGEGWQVPLDLTVSKVMPVGRLPVSFGLCGRYFPVTPSDGPDWGIRAIVTLVLPTQAPKKQGAAEPGEQK